MRTLHAEYLKTKNTFTMWFTIGTSVFIPFMIFLIYLFKHNYYIPKDGVNIWDKFFDTSFGLVVGLLYPLFLILLCSLNLNIEHKSNSWKKIFLLPISRTNFFLSKALFLFNQTIISLIIFYIAILIFGGILGFIHEELQFLNTIPEIFKHFILLSKLLISCMAIISIQYILSVFFKNTVIPITIGIVLLIVGITIANRWTYAIYYPYSFPTIFIRGLKYDTEIFLSVSDWISMSITIVVLIIGTLLFNKKQIK